MSESRETLRSQVIETLLSTFPGAQKVVGGVAYQSDVLDEETGKFYCVEIKATVKNTAPTGRQEEAYDIEKAFADFANKPGRRVADPEKAAAAKAEKEAAHARKEANLAIVRNWVNSHDVTNMTATEIYESIPELSGMLVPQVGGLLKNLCDEGVLNFVLSEKHKKLYSKVG